MGRASKKKWEARIQSAVRQALSLQAKTPFWEKNLFWGPVGIVAGIVLMVVADMKGVRWLLIVAWPWLLLSLLVATGHMVPWGKRILSFIGLLIVFALGHVALQTWLAPEVISDEKLCGEAKVFAQRMRDFDHERKYQRTTMENDYRRKREAAQTEGEKEQLWKEYRALDDRWFNDYSYDYENKLRPEAISLRDQLLTRLPSLLPQMPDSRLVDDASFYNIGAFGTPHAADRLEGYANMLCPTSTLK